MQSYLTLQVARWASIVSEEKLSNTKQQPEIQGKTKPSLQLMWRRDNNPQYLRQETILTVSILKKIIQFD